MNPKLTLGARVRIIEIVGGAAMAIFSLAFWFVMDRMDTRFDRLDQPLGEVRETAAAQTEAINSVNEQLRQMRQNMERHTDGADKNAANIR